MLRRSLKAWGYVSYIFNQEYANRKSTNGSESLKGKQWKEDECIKGFVSQGAGGV